MCIRRCMYRCGRRRSLARRRVIDMQPEPVSIQRPTEPPFVNLVIACDKQRLPRPDQEDAFKENLRVGGQKKAFSHNGQLKLRK